VALVHHELCFGCGRVNLFGLLIELEPTAAGAVAGRGFLKQDHQGPQRGQAHPGIVAAALTEAMALACGPDAHATELQVELVGAAAVGSFLELEARLERRDGELASAVAHARSELGAVARARGRFSSVNA
jgi:acyl-coenzyme A thioesterase PaaI-like protein